jgi:hypothetical protein
MRFTANSFRNSAFSEPFLKRYRKQKLNFLSGTHWLDEVGDYSGTQRPKYVLESDGSAVINSSHITSQTVTSKKGTATATVLTGQIAVGSGWISEIVLSDGTVYLLEESIGTVFFDNSGAGNNATLTGAGTWAIKRDLTLTNNANKNGYSGLTSLSGTTHYNCGSVTIGSNVTWEGEVDIIINEYGDHILPFGFKDWTAGGGLIFYPNNSVKTWCKGVAALSQVVITSDINKLQNFKYGFDGTDLYVDLNDSRIWVSTAPDQSGSITGNLEINQQTLVPKQFNIKNAKFTLNGVLIRNYQNIVPSATLVDLTGNQNATAVNGQGSLLVVPRDNSDITKDAINGNLQFVGRVASDMKFVQSNKGEVGITNDYGQFNFDCTGVTIVSKEGETTVNINQSNNRLIFTGIGNGSIYHIVLSNGLTFPIAEGLGVVSYAENDSTKTLTWFGNFDWSTQDTYHHNITQGFSLVGSVKVPYKINGAYSNAATNGHNQAETKLKQVTFREDFGASSLHFDQSDLSSKVITYADIANTANVFVNQFPNVKINLETFFPSGIINQSNRQNNGLRRNKDTFFGNNK